MSNATYDEEWRKAQELLSSTLQSEPTQADRREQRNLLASLYVRYIIVANHLSECVDQIIQPQKRLLIRRLLESTLGRILELKCDLVEADLCEWTHVGDVIDTLRLDPCECEIQIPTCFRNERKEELIYRKTMIEEVLGKLGFLEKAEVKKPLTSKQAILIIQIHERARQGRLRSQFMKEIRGMKEKQKPVVPEGEEEEGDVALRLSLSAALRIQKIWRGYVARRQTRRRKLQEMLLIGMIPPPKTESEPINRALEISENRRKLQEVREENYQNAITTCRESLEKNQRGPVLEQLSDQVRVWLNEYRLHTGKIPEYTGSDRAVSRTMGSRQGKYLKLSRNNYYRFLFFEFDFTRKKMQEKLFRDL